MIDVNSYVFKMFWDFVFVSPSQEYHIQNQNNWRKTNVHLEGSINKIRVINSEKQEGIWGNPL